MSHGGKRKPKAAPKPKSTQRASMLAREATTRDRNQKALTMEQKRLHTDLNIHALPLEPGRQLRRRTVPPVPHQSDINILPKPPPPSSSVNPGHDYNSLIDQQAESKGMSTDTAMDVRNYLEVAAEEMTQTNPLSDQETPQSDDSYPPPPVVTADLSLQVSLDTPPKTTSPNMP